MGNIATIPTVTVDQMREVDRLMVEDIGVSITMMMEHASRATANLSRTVVGGSVNGKTISILCGKGNNGGDGLAAARHLVNYGALVRVFLATSVTDLNENAAAQYRILQNSNIEVFSPNGDTFQRLERALFESDLVIDALLGYNLKGDPRQPIAAMIDLTNESGKPILAVDIPSGLTGDSGRPYAHTIKAAVTLTLALPKVGLTTDEAKPYVGRLYLADLSVPNTVYQKLGITVPLIYEKEEIVAIP